MFQSNNLVSLKLEPGIHPNSIKETKMQELKLSEVDEVSGGIIPVIVAIATIEVSKVTIGAAVAAAVIVGGMLGEALNRRNAGTPGEATTNP